MVPHTRCAMASGEDADIVARVAATTGEDLSDLAIGASPDQEARLREDVDRLRLIRIWPGRVTVGGFLYDVDTGGLDRSRLGRHLLRRRWRRRPARTRPRR